MLFTPRLSRGSLHDLLTDASMEMSWGFPKLALAMDICRGGAYLPIYTHRFARAALSARQRGLRSSLEGVWL